MTALFVSSPLAAQGDEGEAEFVDELIHSDLPLYTFDWKDLWPRNFYNDDSFGCLSRVSSGDWEFRSDPVNEDGEAYWYRFEIWGGMHCAATLRSAYEREELGESLFNRGFFVRMGESTLNGGSWELWALQQGTIPGSDYILLARQAGDEGVIESFRVLQRRCPEGHMREMGGFDSWLTDYCAINSQAELLGLAQSMLQRRPLGILRRVGDSPDGDDETPGTEPDTSVD